MTQSYLDHPAISRSDLKNILVSPAYFYLKKIKKTIPDKATDPMKLGKILDLAVLDRPTFLKEYELVDELKLPINEYEFIKERSHWDEIKRDDEFIYFEAKEGASAQKNLRDKLMGFYGKQNIVLPETTKTINRCLENLYSHNIVNQILHEGFQNHYMVVDKIFDVECKCEYDLVDTENHIVVDYKTTEQIIVPQLYCHNMKSHCQDIQYYLYSNLYAEKFGRLPSFYFIVQSTLSGEIIVYQPGADVYESGERRTKLALQIYKNCQGANDWPEYLDPDTGGTNNDQIHEIHMPSFYRS